MLHVKRGWNKDAIARSNSEPRVMLTVVGENAFHNGFADVGYDEEIDTRTKTISFLKQFIEENNNECCNDELDD